MAADKKIPTLKYLVSMEPLTEESRSILRAWGEQVGIKVMDIVEGKPFLLLTCLISDGIHGSRGERQRSP